MASSPISRHCQRTTSSACSTICVRCDPPGHRGHASVPFPTAAYIMSDRVEVLALRRDFAELDLFDDLDELYVGRSGAADFLAFGGDHPVDEVDLGAPAFHHVLPHRRARQLAARIRLQP